MAKKKSFIRLVTKKLSRRKVILAAVIGALCIIFVYNASMQDKRFGVEPNSYKPLLDLIATVESKGNYNAYFGNAANSSVNFTAMTIGEVLQWQSQYVNQGSPSSAVGRYQIINTTLSGLVNEHTISTDELYDEQMQDNLATKLLERRGSIAYVNKELTRDRFAANIAQEWASLPKVVGDNPADSYYQGDGLNKSLVPVDKVFGAIEPIKPVR